MIEIGPNLMHGIFAISGIGIAWAIAWLFVRLGEII